MRRRSLLRTMAALPVTALAGGVSLRATQAAQADGRTACGGSSAAQIVCEAEHLDQSPAGGSPVLRVGSPRQAGLLPGPIEAIRPLLVAGLDPSPTYPLYPGAVVLAARDGVVVEHHAIGQALKYASSGGAELPADQQLPMRRDTIFDVASLSKLFTAVVAMQQVERGRIDLDAPVARYVPAFAAGGKAAVTVQQLMTHTAGLPAGLGLDPYPTIEERLAAIYAVALRSAPGTQYLYSDLSFIMVGKIVEHVTGRPLDAVVRTGIIEPLRLRDTMHNPPAELRPRIAPAEWQESGRGLVWGEVHDRTSWLLGGTAGHAGVFSTAHDVAVFGQTLLNGGTYGRTRILQPPTAAAMLTNHNAPLGRGSERGLGFQLATWSYMGTMTTPATFGHTGFTGTSLVIDPAAGTLLVLLTNKVHPTRAWSDLGAIRRAVATSLARAVPVRPVDGRTAWFSGLGDERTATLTLTLPERHARGLAFAYWWDTEPDTDLAVLETSADGGATWTALPDAVVSGYSGRRWHHQDVALPPDATHVRWRYTTDRLYHGRGVYVDAVRLDRRPPAETSWQADGFVRSAD